MNTIDNMVAAVLGTVSTTYGITAQDIIGRSRKQTISDARAVAVKVLHDKSD